MSRHQRFKEYQEIKETQRTRARESKATVCGVCVCVCVCVCECVRARFGAREIPILLQEYNIVMPKVYNT